MSPRRPPSRPPASAGLDGPVLNSIRFGGYLMLSGIPTFIDGRADLFGDAFLARDAAASAGIGTALPDLLEEYAIAWTLFEPSSRPPPCSTICRGGSASIPTRSAVVHRRAAPGADAEGDEDRLGRPRLSRVQPRLEAGEAIHDAAR